jgi:chromosome segregation protein
MRILSLELERYGSFTDRTLHFKPDTRLHVVYGRNAAGKSCALAGITDLFFGIEAQTQFSFLHEGKTMRLGATLQARDLSQLCFKRRKGNKNVLFASDGKPLDETALHPFLGGLTRAVFSHAFGLNSAQLREGAEEMLDSEGEVGATLYAAASGLSGITRLRRELDEEAGTIFKPGKGSNKRRFDQAADAYTQARSEIRKRTLRAETLEGMRTALRSLESQLALLSQARETDRAKHARLTRLRTIAPQLHILDAECENIREFSDLPELSEQAITRLRTAIADSGTSLQKRESAAESLAAAKAALDGITVEASILVHQASVQTLQTNIGKYQSAIKDRARVASDAESKQREIVLMAARVGIAEDYLDSAQPTDAVLAELEDLITQGQKLSQDRERLEASISEAKTKLEELEGDGQASELRDPAAWRTRFDALESNRPLLERSRTLARDSASTRRKLEERSARLSPPVSELESLATLTLPTSEALGRLGNRFSELEDSRRQTEAAIKLLDLEIEEAQTTLNVLVSGEPVASADRIADARQVREESWQQLRPLVLGDDAPIALASRPVIVDLFEARVSEADRLSDAATRDADRVAQYNTEQKSLTNKLTERSKLKEQQTETASQLKQSGDEWLALWASVTSLPGTPGEMVSWIDSVKLLTEQRELLVADEASVAALIPQITELHKALELLAIEVGLENASVVPTDSLLILIDKHLKALAIAWNNRAIGQGLTADAHKQLARFEKNLAAHTLKETAWSASWKIATAALGFDVQASLAAVTAAVKVWRDLPARRLLYEGEMKRVRGMDRDITEFEQEVNRLTQLIAADFPQIPPVDQAIRLNEIVTEQARQQLLYETAEGKVEQDSSGLETAERNADRDSKLVLTRMSESALTGEPIATLERLERVTAIRSRINAARSTLIAQSDGLPEDQLRTELDGFDSQATLIAIQLLAQSFPAQDGAINQVFADKSAQEKALIDAESGSGAEVALQQLKSAEVEIETAARDYLTLALSAKMLNRVIEEHRATQSAPLMQSAGTLFRSLTSGAFTHIDQEFDPDDNDRPQLVGVRDTGKSVCIDGLSEGQRDQLYLALRMAYLDDYAKKSEPVPFIGDDIFTTFDEVSTRAGLLALADIGLHLQPILFTHHRFVADMAKEVLGDQVDIIEL